MECTLDTCAQESDLHLCSDCQRDLQAILDKIPELVTVLDLIGRKVEQPFTVRTSNRPSGGPKPSTPLNLSAVSLATKLRMAADRTANDYAHDEDAAWKFEHIEQSVRDADRMVNGEDEKVPDQDQIKERIREAQGDPKPPKECRAWLAEKAGIQVTAKDIENWVYYKHLRYVLDRVTTDKNSKRIYFPGEVFQVHSRMQDRRRTAA